MWRLKLHLPDPTAEPTTDVTATPAATDGTEVSEISVESLIADISKSCYDTTGVWTLFDMVVCGGYKTDLTQRLKRVTERPLLMKRTLLSQ